MSGSEDEARSGPTPPLRKRGFAANHRGLIHLLLYQSLVIFSNLSLQSRSQFEMQRLLSLRLDPNN